MATIVIGLFDNTIDAKAALRDLQSAVFSGNNVSLVQARGAAARPAPLCLLRRGGRHRRPPAPAVPRRAEHLAEHRRGVHPLQQPQG